MSEDYRPSFNVPKFFRECDRSKESKKIAWIIHSSGSTGFPKPIFITNFGCLANWHIGLGFRSFTVSPLFHSHALMEFGRAMYAKRPMFFGNHAFPVTRQNLLAAMRVAKPEMVCAVPYVLKLLAEKDEGTLELAKAKIVMYGGSACPDALGDELVSKGVTLAGNYGATETGFIMNSFRPAGDNEWNYLRLHRPVADFVLMDEISPGVFECVALDGLPSKETINSDDPPNSFRTRDLFTRHPDPAKSNYWKYLSRLDDRITLVNGEKVLPIPIEGHIRQHELIREVAVFGVQRTVPGVILFRSEHSANLSNEEFLDRVWPQIEEANSQAETFSHIPRDLVAVMPPDTTYPRTDKGTIIRAQLYDQFANVINQLYEIFENGAQQSGRGSGNASLLQLDVPELETYLLGKFRSDLNVALESADSDIFAAGVDSLQTTRLWTTLKKELNLAGNASKMSQNIVFERGTVRSLAKYLYNLRLSGDDEDEDANDELDVQNMCDLIERFSRFVPHDSADKPTLDTKSVLLTGATGTLGAHLLYILVQRPDISNVYALVRAAGHHQAQERVTKALSTRNLLSALKSEHLSKITALASDLSLPNLGLSQSDLATILDHTTHTIHSAYPVNFNLPLSTFTPALQSVYNLLNICLSTAHSKPSSFGFCSSISAASGTPKPATIPETHISDLRHAQPIGYGRSKLVAEHMVRNCHRQTGVGRVLRIGQLAGDSMNADWNDTEAIPLMVRSLLSGSLGCGCLPRLKETISWLPVDIAAGIIEDLVFRDPASASAAEAKHDSQNDASGEDSLDSDSDSDSDSDLAYHILNPCTFSFESDFLPMLSSHPDVPPFEVVPVHTWLARLRHSEPDVVLNPSRKLLQFWETKYANVPAGQNGGGDETWKGLVFETRRTRRRSARLGTVRDPVGDGLMARIVAVWMRNWRGQSGTA